MINSHQFQQAAKQFRAGRISLSDLQLSAGDIEIPVEIPAGARMSLIDGRWDPIAELLDGEAAVAEVASELEYVSGAS